ncbi:MAG: LysM peptidoglycan-binding domain-containing protein [Chitinophagales bacterium]|nr:LysM peptidoglycan-binding domain-containing protein [Chitinophagales bacterium]HMV02560.1 LysM peptidoglycan-binding domain-containing protein [Chitinophagales bacterium]HMY42361.1 LysM peptidoglycan-binding domain-containing protein [Chitinophagales bacterium]HNB38919.1 LysM peptidoglycan-binding domain-containing protein [Chitinophagales bacterium]HNE86165.1 LysM peptidoglycan-binding domain-containing protein [Chitinophagales bacterium]
MINYKLKVHFLVGVFLFLSFGFAIAQNFIIHKVEKGETLYGLSKKYKTTVDAIYKNNPALTSDNLKLGTELRIPQPKELIKKPTTPTTTPLPSVSDNKKVEIKSTMIAKAKIDTILHQIQAKETLYGLSKKYNVSIDDIRKWNKLSDAGIQIGMILKILKPASISINPNEKVEVEKKNEAIQPTVVEKVVVLPEKQTPIKIDTEKVEPPKEVEKPVAPKTLSLYELFANQPKSALKKIKATGAPMNTTDESIDNTFFALHKTAQLGSVIKVKNLENNKVSYAKVIGKLPDTDENRKVLVRLSLGVRNAIKMNNGKAYLEMEFINE